MTELADMQLARIKAVENIPSTPNVIPDYLGMSLSFTFQFNSLMADYFRESLGAIMELKNTRGKGRRCRPALGRYI